MKNIRVKVYKCRLSSLWTATSAEGRPDRQQAAELHFAQPPLGQLTLGDGRDSNPRPLPLQRCVSQIVGWVVG